MIYTRSHSSSKNQSKLITLSKGDMISNTNIVKSLEFKDNDNDFNDSSLDISNIDDVKDNKNSNHVSTISWLDHDLKYKSYDVDDLQQSFDILDNIDNQESQYNDINCLDKCKKINLSKLNLNLTDNEFINKNDQEIKKDNVKNISITLSPLQKNDDNASKFDLIKDYDNNELIDVKFNEKSKENKDLNSHSNKTQIDCKKLNRK